MRRKQTKSFMLGFIVAAILFGICIPTTAASRQTIATYNGAKIMLNGSLLSTKDAETVVIDGTNYLPVRAIAESLDLVVGWNSYTNTIILESVGNNKTNTTAIEQNTNSITKNNYSSIENTNSLPTYNYTNDDRNYDDINYNNEAKDYNDFNLETHKPYYDESPKTITTASELESYLNLNMGELQTPIGNYEYKIDIWENTSDIFPWDYDIKVELTGKTPWYDLKYDHSYSDSDKQKTINILRRFQEDVYNISSSYFPDKKLTGCYYSGYYKYRNIRAGYTSTRALTWRNYSVPTIGSYKDSELSSFHWYSNIDDYTFNY